MGAQVVRAAHGDELVAIKVVRNKPAYTKQGLIEIGLLEHLNRVDGGTRARARLCVCVCVCV